jgi:hypothetical protein
LLAAVLFLALLPWVGVPGVEATVDEQFVEAAQSGDLALIRLLLDKGADVNSTDLEDRSALMRAAS